MPLRAAAEVLGVRRAILPDLVNGKAALSPQMALRIEKAFGVSMDTLSRMQAWYDSQRAGVAGRDPWPATRTVRGGSLRPTPPVP